MHILMLSWEYPPRVVGGLARHVQELSRALVRAGHRVEVVTVEAPPEPAEAEDEGVNVWRVPIGYPQPRGFFTWVLYLNFALLEGAVSLLERRGRPEVIHAHDWVTAFAARCLKHALKIPLVATIHATEYGRNRGLYNDLQRQISDVEWWLTYEAWRVICCSAHMRQELETVLQVPTDKIDVIPNGVDPAMLCPPEGWDLVAFRQRYARPEEKIIFYVGRLVPEKGAQILLEAAPKILTYSPATKIIIAGTGPMASSLRARAEELAISDQVVFTDFIDDPTRNALYAVADVAVFPSTYEPFGIVALEAMAAGVPVVVGDTGGFREIVIHGVNGLKCYPGDPDSLANNVLTLFHDPALAASLREEGRREAVAYFGWDRMAQMTAAVYERVLTEYHQSGWRRFAPQQEEEALLASIAQFFGHPAVGRYLATGEVAAREERL